MIAALLEEFRETQQRLMNSDVFSGSSDYDALDDQIDSAFSAICAYVPSNLEEAVMMMQFFLDRINEDDGDHHRLVMLLRQMLEAWTRN